MTDDIDAMSLDDLRIAVAREVIGYSDIQLRWCEFDSETGRPYDVERWKDWDDDARQIPCFNLIDTYDWTEEEKQNADRDRDWVPLPDYPRDIAAAWLVISCLCDSGWGMEVSFPGATPPLWHVLFYPDTTQLVRRDAYAVWREGDSAPEVICRAALGAIRTIDEEARS